RGTEDARKALLRTLISASPPDLEAVIAQASRLGLDLRQGAVALFARRISAESRSPDELQLPRRGLLADLGEGRIYGLLSPLPAVDSDGEAEVLAADLRSRGMMVALSVRRDPAGLHDALREAELLVELAGVPDSSLYSHEETYRLLIGVLLRDPGELELLRAQTILPLTAYDSKHETELLATLQEFLIHHGSTTETAAAMALHRHTVGYRLSRVQEVSGLSPYESDGRERLSLGLKAHRILEADERRAAR
ncbi:MAG: helix-turn-helix domain-containing protein, partial [Actinomycetota bacterium]|nr:helix-turn-helix domain-containing protein [Actinomycetota bacterium]